MTTTTHAALLERLREKFPDEAHRALEKGGRTFTYIPGREVETRLNDVLGNRWSWEVSAVQTFGNKDGWPMSVVARGTLTVEWPDGQVQRMAGEGGVTVKFTNAGNPVDLGDEVKGACTDACKKAAQRIGVGAYLARSEDAIEAMANQAAGHDAAEAQGAEKDAEAITDGWESHQDRTDSLNLLRTLVADIPESGSMRQAWTAHREDVTGGKWPPTNAMWADLMDRAALILEGDITLPGEEPFPDSEPTPPSAAPEAPPWLATVTAAMEALVGARKSAVTRLRRREGIGDDPSQWTDDQARAVLDFIAAL